MRALGCEKFLPGPAWVVLSKTGPPFSGTLYASLLSKKIVNVTRLSL